MAIGTRHISGREEIRNGITGTTGVPLPLHCGSSTSGGPPARAKSTFRMGVIIGSGGSARTITIFAGQNGGAGGTSCMPREPVTIDCGTSVSGGPPSGAVRTGSFFGRGGIIGSGGSALAITIFAGQIGEVGGASAAA